MVYKEILFVGRGGGGAVRGGKVVLIYVLVTRG